MINKIDKLLDTLVRKIKHIQITNIRNEKENTIACPTDIKKIAKKYMEDTMT